MGNFDADRSDFSFADEKAVAALTGNINPRSLRYSVGPDAEICQRQNDSLFKAVHIVSGENMRSVQIDERIGNKLPRRMQCDGTASVHANNRNAVQVGN